MSAYQPFQPAARPGGRPATAPQWRVLVHRKYAERWEGLADRVGLEAAQRFWDHVAMTPNRPPAVGSATVLRGKAGDPMAEGFSRTLHYEVSGAGRLDYQYNNAYRTSDSADPHPVVFIRTIELGSH